MPALGPSALDTAPSGGPLYQQVRDALADHIAAGRWRPGQRLPSERRLCETFGISRVTVRRALTSLVEEGLLEVAAGRGWFVATGPLSEPPNLLLSFTAMARARGLEPSAVVREHTVRGASMDEAETLRMAPGAELVHLERVRLLDGISVAVDRSVVPLARCPILAQADFTRASLYEVLREHAGLVPSYADTTVEAVAAGEELARLLDLSPSWPVLVTTQTTFDQHERPLEASRIVYRGDRYRFRARLAVTRP
jgi:GntR family transcriptional regulator